MFPQVFSRPEKNGKVYIFGIITKKDGKTKVLEANAESEESRTEWMSSIKAVFKDDPSYSAKTGDVFRTVDKKSADGTTGAPEKEKDCQCIIS